MPLGPYRDFDQCTTKQRRRGLAKENAARYCGAIKRDVKGSRAPVTADGIVNLLKSLREEGVITPHSIKVHSPTLVTYVSDEEFGIEVTLEDEGNGFWVESLDPMWPGAEPERHAFRSLGELRSMITAGSGPYLEEKPDVEAAFSSREMVVVTANHEPIHRLRSDGHLPWYVNHYDYMSEDLLSRGYRVLNSAYGRGASSEKFPFQWGKPINGTGTADVLEARGIAASYNDTIGPISVSITDGDWRPDNDDNDEPRPMTPRPTGGRALEQPKTLVAAIGPDDWSYDFPTLLDALEFKDRLASSGPMGRQVADKLVFRKKRLRYMAYGLPHHEKAYLERFVGQDRGPWQKREPHDEVI